MAMLAIAAGCDHSSNSHTPHSPLPTTRNVVLITRGYELDPRSKSRVAAIQIGSFLARVRAVIV